MLSMKNLQPNPREYSMTKTLTEMFTFRKFKQMLMKIKYQKDVSIFSNCNKTVVSCCVNLMVSMNTVYLNFFLLVDIVMLVEFLPKKFF